MFFNDLIQRKLSSLLLPWLRDEPELELELKLGFLRSNGVLNNVHFNISALNELLDDPGSLRFKEFTVDQLSVRVTNWLTPSFSFQVNGLNITLSTGEEMEDQGRARQRPKVRDTSAEDLEKHLVELDPEGSALHDAIRRISHLSGTSWRTSLYGAILGHCRLRICGINVLLESPCSDDPFLLSVEVKELGAQPQDNLRSYWRGFSSSIFVPSGERSFNLDVRGFEIGLRNKKSISSIVLPMDLFSCVTLKNLQFTTIIFSVPSLKFSFSPSDLSIILLFYASLSRKSNYARNGRQLWRIAANRISSLVPVPKLSLHKVVCDVCLWMRYLHSYENMLLLVGYPVYDRIKRTATVIAWDRTVLGSFRNQLTVISEIEKDLPPEAVAQARKIARYKAVSCAEQAKDIYDKSLVQSLFWKIYQALALIWNVICRVLYSITCVFLSGEVVTAHANTIEQLEAISDDSFHHCCIALQVGEFLISVSPEYVVRPLIRKKLVPEIRMSYENLLSFHLSVDAFFLRYVQNFSEQHLTFASGCFKAYSSSSMEDGSNNLNNIAGQKKFHNMQTILWSEPAEFSCSAETFGANPANKSVEDSPHHLDFLIGKLRAAWENISQSINDRMMQTLEKPGIVCDSKSILTNQSHKGCTPGFWDCGLVMGKFNYLLEYSSIISVAALYRQLQLVLHVTNSSNRTNVVSYSPSTWDDLPEEDWITMYNSSLRRIKMALLNMLPQRHIQIAALIAGPCMQISLRKENLDGINAELCHVLQKDEVHFSFFVHDIELVVSPELKSVWTSSIGDKELCESKLNFCGLKNPQEIETLQSDRKKNIEQGEILLGAHFKFNGLKAYIGGPSEIPGYQFIILSPTTIKVSSSRKSVLSFGSTVIAFSATLHLIASGFSTLLFLDELFVLVKVCSGLFYASNGAISFLNSVRGIGCQEKLRQLMKREETSFITTKQSPLVVTDVRGVVRTSFEFNSVSMVLSDSWRSYDIESHRVGIDAVSGRKLGIQKMPDCGIHIFVQQLTLDFSLEEEIVKILIDLTKFRSALFRYSTQVSEISDQINLENLLRSLDCLSDALLSRCKLSVCLTSLENAQHSASLRDTVTSTSYDLVSDMPDNSPFVMNAERSRQQSLNWILATLSLNEIYLVGSPVKNKLFSKHKADNLEASLSVAGQFQTISCRSQGGSIFIETTALVKFIDCFSSYFEWIKDLCTAASSSMDRDPPHVEDISRMDTHMWQPHQIRWDFLETITMDLSQFSLALLASEESGKVDQLLFEINSHLDLKMSNMTRVVSFVISKLSVLSLYLFENIEAKKLEIQIPVFSSTVTLDSSSMSVDEDPSAGLEHETKIIRDNMSSSSPSISRNDYYSNDSGESSKQIGHSNRQNYILKDLSAFLTFEWPPERDLIDPLLKDGAWVGNGSISDLELAISLRELQMILFAVESMVELFGNETSKDVSIRQWSSDQEPEEHMEGRLPDGTVIAIQDVYQHMYIVVEGAQSRYNLGGAVHYSLVGERALFRVKYHTTRWKSQVQYFSLLSLYAKSESGEPLRLNCCPRSDFLNISGTDDSAWSLWRATPYRGEADEGDIEWESYRPLSKNTFSLENKKNDCSVAFIDGLWELTSKQGNPLKMKVLHGPPPSRNHLLVDHYSLSASGNTITYDSQMDDKRKLDLSGMLSGIVITIGKVNLTIVHELTNSPERFPLLQGSINATEVIVQIFNTKARIMSTLGVLLHYYDARRNMWRELVNQLEICIFYRSKGSGNISNGVPVHLYARINEFNISLSELSLDIILFVIGKLNLAGPYAIRSSTILANCYKVQNSSGLSLLCQFNNEQNVSVAGQQSVTIFLRHLASRNQPSETLFFSARLFGCQPLSTSLIHLSLAEAEAVAWRTRILSSQESKTFPGPFVVVEVSRTMEDGLSIIISPLLRIHNETDFSMELRFQRPQKKETEFASLLLKAGDTIDDAMVAFGAVDFSGGSKKALISLGVGNFLFSFRPNLLEGLNNEKISSVEWSEDLKGGKPVRLSRIFDKLTYQVRKAFSVKAVKSSLSSAHCALKSEDGRVSNIHFLIQSIGREIPVIQTDSSGNATTNSPVVLQEQKEIFLLPTVRFTNFLHTDIHVNLTDKDPQSFSDDDNMGKQATISSGSSANLYANPSTIYFVVTLTSFDSSSKPVNSSDWVKKLEKVKNTVQCLDIELDFGGGKYFAFLRLSRGQKGMLEAAIFTSFSLENDTNFALLCFAANQKPLSRGEEEYKGSGVYPESGCYLPPKSTRSWLLKYPKVRFKLLEEKALEALLDLDALSGFTEIDLEIEEKPGNRNIMKFGVSVRPPAKLVVPSQIVSLKPRYVLLNESEEIITFRQCYMEGDMEGIVAVNRKQRVTLMLRAGIKKKRENTVFENFLKKHRKADDDSLLLIQFRPDEAGLGWSGPVCIASLGRFFLKFRRYGESSLSGSDHVKLKEPKLCEFAAVHVVEEGSTIVLHFHKPPTIDLPYRIENCLRDSPVTYYQKGSSEPEILGSGAIVDYVWDDLTLPHKLVVQIDDVHLLREINLDKLRGWKPFYKTNQNRGLGFQLPQRKVPANQRSNFGRLASTETVKLGYEVYADGLTRVLRICEFSERRKEDTVIPSSSKMRLKISCFTIQMLERARQELDMNEQPTYAPVIATRLKNINIESLSTGLQKFNRMKVQSLSVDQKWVGAPFAAMLRRHQSESYDVNDNILHVTLVLLPPSSGVRQVKYLSMVLQPLDLNLDEETLIKIIPFWRTSLSDTPSQQYYFDHFEIHPIKIVASFLPGDSYSSYSSTQETMRSLLHSVIKIPAIKNKVVELNGVLVTHALITLSELSFRCAQHYSWYILRAIYIAKGSPLLPPAFASMFDDLASSSLDVFFDPSNALVKLPGLTLGTFKLLKKCIDGKGFSGTKRYFGDLGKTLKLAGSNILFAGVTEISDSILRGAETNGWKGMISGFRQGILHLAMEPSVLGNAFLEGGPDRKIKLDRSPGVDELYIEGYLQAMLDSIYKQEYLRVRVMDNQVVLKNLPPNSSLVDEIMERVKGFLVSKALLKGDSVTSTHSLRHIRGESEWRLGPTLLTLCEHLFVSFAIRFLRKRTGKVISKVRWRENLEADDRQAIEPASGIEGQKVKLVWKWGIAKFVLSVIIAYIDGRLCRSIPNPLARRIVSGYLLSFIDNNEDG